MSTADILPLANHLWQSTLFGIAVWLISLTLRKNRAAVRHRLWLAASVKFLVPFSLLAAIGSSFQWNASTPRAVSLILEMGQPFSGGPSIVFSGAAPASSASRLFLLLIGVWAAGTVASLYLWFMRWRQVRKAMSLAVPSNLDGPVRVMFSPQRFEPGVFGVFRP